MNNDTTILESPTQVGLHSNQTQPVKGTTMNTKDKTAFATDWGTVGKVTDEVLLTGIAILENFELPFCSFDPETGDETPDDWEITQANEIVTLIAFLQKELDKRAKAKISRHVWKEAAQKGYRKGLPSHDRYINGVIDTVAKEAGIGQ